jgi:hypothetical protein
MAADDDGRARLTKAIEDRRIYLRMSWDEVARGADISVAHLRRIRSGAAPLTPMVARGLEESLQWDNGSVNRVLAGGEPRIVHVGSAQMSATSDMTAVAEVVPAVPDGLPDGVVWDDLPPLEQHLWLSPASPHLRQALVNIARAYEEEVSGGAGAGIDQPAQRRRFA